MLAVLDCQISGIAGDMLLSSLVDLGADRNKVTEAIMSCQNFLPGSRINKAAFEEVKRSGMRATWLNLDYEDKAQERKGTEIFDAVAACCNSLDLDNRTKAFALGSIRTLIEAEARVHGEQYANVHLHEASSIDTLVDVIGTAVALQDLGLLSADIYSTKVAVGAGALSFSHGTISNPGSAVLEILKGRNFTLVGGPVESELTTPTGAAILANLAKGSVDFYPAIQPVKVGYGAGTNDIHGVPNVLKVVLGREVQKTAMDTVYMLETNVDDASGEVIGNMAETLMEKGAKDVSVIPLLAKKGRPGYLIRVICDYEQAGSLLDTLIQESGTLGVRVQPTQRHVVPRTLLSVPISIMGEDFVVRVKVVKREERIVYAKPEHDDVKDIASRLNIPYREAHSLVDRAVTEKLVVM